jgi:hypothetical protein
MVRVPAAIAVVYVVAVIQSAWVDAACPAVFTPRLLLSLSPAFVLLPGWGAVVTALTAGAFTSVLRDQPPWLPCVTLLFAAWLHTSERVGVSRRPIAAALCIAVFGSLGVAVETVVAAGPEWRSIDWLSTARTAWGVGLASAIVSAPLCWFAAFAAASGSEATGPITQPPRWRRSLA